MPEHSQCSLPAYVAGWIQRADALVVAAGAGMGVDSGLPDFRGDSGFWKAYPALAAAKVSFSQIASPATFRSDPRLAWGFYGHRLNLYRNTVPHTGFGLILDLAEKLNIQVGVFTSNVDGQFQKAGFPDERIHECHGSLNWLQCSQPCGHHVWSADDLQPDVDEQLCRWRGELPVCPLCGSLARPNVLMFGDGQWVEDRTAKQADSLHTWLGKFERPLIIEIGAGTTIPSVREFSEQTLAHMNGWLIRINPRECEVHQPHAVSLSMGGLAGVSLLSSTL